MSKALSAAIKTEARRLGFDLVGITTASPPASYPTYQRWLENNHHGEMGYLATEQAQERRADPSLILPECRSILVLGIRYNQPTQLQPGDSSHPIGRVASYAWGDDYHDVLPEKLKALISFIEQNIGKPVPNRWYSDTGPILEHDLAQRAGIGWIGKNSLLINPKLGSYFLLSEILLGIELPPDEPFQADHCGSCTRCIDACPTACILPNRTIDARACISYLTIELKTAIPMQHRSQMGEWVFGCDVCQDVCPWNIRFATESGEPAFTARPNMPLVDLQKELELSPQEFNAKFKGSPIKRTKRRGYLRNVAVALGNAGDENSIPVLTAALKHHDEPIVRGHAAWALGQIGGTKALAALQAALAHEGDIEVLTEITTAFANLSEPESD